MRLAAAAECEHEEMGDMTRLLFNVAQLLREEVGARRKLTFSEAQLPLDDTLVLRDVQGDIRFTRTTSGVFADVWARGVVQLECVRSLELFDYSLELEMHEEFHSVVDVITAMPLSTPTEEDPFLLNELHMADVGELIREYALLELPLNPVSEAYRDQPIRYTVETEPDPNDDATSEADDEPVVDERLAVLKSWRASQN
jgi:uncharacterized protein